MDSRGIVFELQWKKKQGAICKQEDFASLGIWDTADSSLDWTTFKSYLSQNLGTFEDITVAYVDSEGDELPIESECEFQEALKFARQRARKGRKIVLKVDHPSPTPDMDFVEQKRLWKLPKHTKHGRDVKSDQNSDSASKNATEILTCELEDLQKHNKYLIEKLESMPKLEEFNTKCIPEKDDVPPSWFKKYMQKMKSEIVMEVTANTKQMLASMVLSLPSLPADRHRDLVASRNKKKISDEDSSDAALGSDQRDHRLLRKIEKLHKREKKLERKLDSKLEKLENKTKRMMEKKSQSKPRPEWERVPERKIPRKRSNDAQAGPYLMDAIVLNDGPKAETHIKIGKRFTKIWEVMNTGTLPWTDKTEVRLAWGTLGLEPEEPYIKCPILEPGEKGQIAVNFRAPDFSGTFESYWHFYHMGERFGHWIGCAVVVEEPNKCGKSAVSTGLTDNREMGQKQVDGALSKKSFNSEKGEQGNFEKLDNIDALKKENPSASESQKSSGASINENLNNIEVESNMQKVDTAVDLSIKAKSVPITSLISSHSNNNNINEPSTSGLVTETAKEKDPEYVSDSDDDNLSIISTAGLSSDSEDEKFVIVPMPACFMRDVPLGSKNVPVVVKDNSAKQPISTSRTSTALLDIPSEELNKNKETTTENDVDDDVDFSAVTSHEAGEKWWDSEDFKSNVYAVDAKGCCVPLETAWPVNETTKIPLGYAAKPCPSPKRYQPDTASQETSAPKPEHVPPKSNRTFSQSFNTFTHTFSHVHHPFPQPNPPNHSTQYANCFSGTLPSASNTNGNDASSQGKDKTQSTSSSQMGNENTVHILPETIVNGAINAASSAYSTARAVISNLRSIPTGIPSAGLPREDPHGEMSTTTCLKLLYDMGFRNSNLNVLLLQRYDNDIGKVVAELLRGNTQAGF